MTGWKNFWISLTGFTPQHQVYNGNRNAGNTPISWWLGVSQTGWVFWTWCLQESHSYWSVVECLKLPSYFPGVCINCFSALGSDYCWFSDPLMQELDLLMVLMPEIHRLSSIRFWWGNEVIRIRNKRMKEYCLTSILIVTWSLLILAD